MLELSERLGMTLAELGGRMSASELMKRRALDLERAAEKQRAHDESVKEAEKARRRR